jgi:hypothetical protein
LNTAPNKIADITLKEIMGGITIERLESLTVPVYQYGGQITIHGIFKDIDSDLRVHGYKSVFLNGNKSLGVKYVAIDGLKKSLLHDVSRFGKNKWSIAITSQGCMASRIFISNNNDEDKQRCIDCYKSTPDDLYIGNKVAGGLVFGGYVVILHIGAIYQSNLWKLIKKLTGIESQVEYETLEQLDKAKRERESAEYEAQRKIEQEVKQVELANAIKSFVPPSNWQPFKGKIESVGTYARIYDTWESGIALQIIKVVKRGAYLCSHVKNFKDFKYVDWQTSDKAHKCERSINGWVILDKPVKTPQTTENKATVTNPDVNGQDITISHNEKLNGIEIAFKSKPSDSVLDILRANGFRWSYKSMLWYARYNPDLMNKIKAELIGDKELCKSTI